MKKSIAIRVICLVVAFIMLGGAVAYAAITGSPYETLKKATIDALAYRNVTVESEMTLTVNGVPQPWSTKTHYVAGDETYLEYQYDEYGNQHGASYYENGLIIWLSPLYEEGDIVWYSCSVRQQYRSPYMQHNPSPYTHGLGDFAIIGPEDRVSAQMRFVELFVDVLVGDMKNNITMSTSDGMRLVRGSLTENQIPELIHAAVDMLIEGQSGWYDGDYDRDDFEGWEQYELPVKNLDINYVTGEAVIDADGDLLYVKGVIKATVTNIFGDVDEWALEFNASFSDIGTSSPVCPVIGIEKLLPPGFMDSNNRGDFFTASFAVGPDGFIIEGSDTPPGLDDIPALMPGLNF